MGLLLAVVVHSAGIQDRVGARALLIRLFMLAWLISQSRRLSKDEEVSVASAEAFIRIACVRRMPDFWDRFEDGISIKKEQIYRVKNPFCTDFTKTSCYEIKGKFASPLSLSGMADMHAAARAAVQHA